MEIGETHHLRKHPLVKPSKSAPGHLGENKHKKADSFLIWWNIGTCFDIYIVPEKISFVYEEWAGWLDCIGFRSTRFQICPKHLPLSWVYFAPLFDHIWLFLLSISGVIEVANKRFCKYPKKSCVSSWLFARKYLGLTGWSQKQEAAEYSVDISPDEGMDVWIYVMFFKSWVFDMMF